MTKVTNSHPLRIAYVDIRYNMVAVYPAATILDKELELFLIPTTIIKDFNYTVFWTVPVKKKETGTYKGKECIFRHNYMEKTTEIIRVRRNVQRKVISLKLVRKKKFPHTVKPNKTVLEIGDIELEVISAFLTNHDDYKFWRERSSYEELNEFNIIDKNLYDSAKIKGRKLILECRTIGEATTHVVLVPSKWFMLV